MPSLRIRSLSHISRLPASFVRGEDLPLDAISKILRGLEPHPIINAAGDVVVDPVGFFTRRDELFISEEGQIVDSPENAVSFAEGLDAYKLLKIYDAKHTGIPMAMNRAFGDLRGFAIPWWE